MTADHSQVLQAAVAGSPPALAELVRQYHDRVYRFGVRVCRDPFDADDAVQEAFVKLARRPDVQEHPGALAWLMTVVRNACLRMLRPFVRARRRLAETELDPRALPAASLGPEEALARWELIDRVHAALAALDPPYREVLILREIEGLTGSEVCESLQVTEAAMKSRLHRARQMLRERLEVE